jgi:Methyltransferase domain
VPRRIASAGRTATRDRPATSSASERFRSLDAYRVRREWERYEGTAQRDLFRTLRARFLARHPGPGGWALDLGSGPLRFTAALGLKDARRVALDLSAAMLRFRGPSIVPSTDRVRGDAARPPFAKRSATTVAVIGNTLGFAGDSADAVLDQAIGLTAPGGVLLLEIAPGPGERSRYLARLPTSSVARLLRSPVGAVLPRLTREGFEIERVRRAEPGEFRRFAVPEIVRRLAQERWRIREVLVVAPSLGPDATALEAVARDAKAWSHLLELEEEVGRNPARWPAAAAILAAAEAPAAAAKH